MTTEETEQRTGKRMMTTESTTDEAEKQSQKRMGERMMTTEETEQRTGKRMMTTEQRMGERMACGQAEKRISGGGK